MSPQATAIIVAFSLVLCISCGVDRGESKPANIPKGLAAEETEHPGLTEVHRNEAILDWAYPGMPMEPGHVVVSIPEGASRDNRMPVLVALHGQGESRKSPKDGAHGWLDDYHMKRAIDRLASPPLTVEDYQGMIEPERLASINKSLETRPYRGLIIACPYLPDRFRRDEMAEDAKQYARFVVDGLLVRIYAEVPSIGKPESTGIDGVSLGGRAAVMVGTERPASFGSVSGLQSAFGEQDIEMILGRMRAAREKNQALRIRLLSSEQDRFLKVTKLLSKTFEKFGVRHRLDIVKGDHSYEFNQGPGVYEMLLYHDRVLRGEEYL